MLSLLEMSITGGIFVAVVVILRAVLINRLPKRVFLAFWGAALCCLLIPFRVPSPTSVYTATGQLIQRPGILTGQATTAAEPAGWAIPVPLLIWFGVALACALAFLIVHLHSRIRYQASLPVDCPTVVAWTERHRLRRPVQVRCSDQIDAPLTYGVLWPVVLLPKAMDWGDETKITFILAHEYTHIRRFDIVWKIVLAATLCIHWFNPLVWVMYLLASRDLELSCDESVVRMYGRDARAPYALTLVGMEERRAHFTPFASCFAKNALEERITAIMKSKKYTIAGIAAALVLTVAVVVVFATSAPNQQAPSESPIATHAPAEVKLNAGSSSASNDTPITAVTEGGFGPAGEATYTQEQYNMVAKALKIDGYADMPIAAFNRKVYAIFSNPDTNNEELYTAYDMVLASLPETDPNAGYFCNTIQASLKEYHARLDEVYSGQTVDPSFRGSARRIHKEDVYGDEVQTFYLQADYSFKYRILNQDALTVQARDQFLQAILQGAQGYLDGKTVGQLIDDQDGEAHFKEAVEKAGKAASNANISFTSCEVDYYENYG